MTIRFFVTGLSPGEEAAGWTARAKKWLHELVYEPSTPSQVVVPEPAPQRPVAQQSRSWIDWLIGIFLGIIPSSLTATQGVRPRKPLPTPTSARPPKPAKGAHTTGEVVARLQKDSDGKYQFTSISIDFPRAWPTTLRLTSAETQPGSYRVNIVTKDSRLRSPATGLSKLFGNA